MGKASAPAFTAESIAWGAILFAVFMTPLAMSDFGWLGIERPLTADIYTEAKLFVLRASTFVALAGWVWSVLVDGRPLRRTVLDPWVLALIGWLAVTTVVSVHPLTSLFGHYTRGGGWLTYVLYAALFFLTVQFADKGSRMLQVAKAVFWSGAIVSAYGVLQYLGVDWVRDTPAFLVGRAYSTLGNPLTLGSYLVFVLPVSAALALIERLPSWRAVYWAGTLMSLAAMLVTFTRSAWIGGVVACVLFVAYVVIQRVGIDRRIDLPFAGVAVTMLALVTWRSAAASDGVTNVFARLGELFQFDSGSGFSRVGLWKAAYDATLDRPLTGFGLDTFRLFSTGYLSPEYARAGDYLAIPDRAHSYPFELASTTGLVGLVLVFAILGIAAWVSARKTLLLPRGSARSTHILLAAFWAAAAGYVVNLLASISMPQTTSLLWITMALLLSPSASARPVRSVAGARVLATVVAGLCAVAVLASTVPLYADARYLASRTLPEQRARIEAADDAVRLAPYHNTYRTTRAVAYADQVIGSLPMAAAIDDSQRAQLRLEYEAALEELHAAREFSPWEQNNYNVLAVMYNVGGRYLDAVYHDGAIRIAEEGLDRFLHAPNLRLQYAIALEAVGRLDEARDELERLVDIEPRMAEAVVQLARLYVADRETGRATELLRAAESTVINRALVINALESLERGEPIPSVAW
ncbi:MAG: O-antigen ligase family protein [Coriobacteriia bacterium]|nr:O-antigen ligase family protein [Coriobacteriia bacterium]